MPQNSNARIIQYWFGPKYHHSDISPQQRLRWFGKDAAINQKIRRLFHPVVLEAGDKKRDRFHNVPKGTIAFILLLDQFPRHLWRDSP